MIWRSAIASPMTSTGAGGSNVIGQSGPTAARRVDRVLEHRDEIHALVRERAALVEPGQEQQVVDQRLHPRRSRPGCRA